MTTGAKPLPSSRDGKLRHSIPVDLYSEQDVTSKVIVPYLTSLGYDETKTKRNGVVVRHNHPINAQQGREKRRSMLTSSSRFTTVR